MLIRLLHPFGFAIHARLAPVLILAIALFVCSMAQVAQAQPSAKNYPDASWLKRCRAGEWILYTSGFEDVSLGGTTSQTSRLQAQTVEPCPDPSSLLPRLSLGNAQIQYQGGDEAQRAARIVDDPVNPGNKVLRFWLAAPNVTTQGGENTSRGRIQLNVYENKGAREMLVFMRARLSGGFAEIQAHHHTFSFLTLSEFWNNASWSNHPYPFRITVNLVKEMSAPGAPMRFGVEAQTISKNSSGASSFSTLWSQVQRNFEVPTNQWMTIRYHLIEGNAGGGLFRMTVTPDGGKQVLVFDVQAPTHHPYDPAPDGFGHFNPMKLYTADALLKAAKAHGADGLTVDWDDLLIKIRETPGPIVRRSH